MVASMRHRGFFKNKIGLSSHRIHGKKFSNTETGQDTHECGVSVDACVCVDPVGRQVKYGGIHSKKSSQIS